MWRFPVSNTARTIIRGQISSKSCAAIKVNCFATYKTSTGLVGLAVDPNGRENLQAISQKVLDAAKKLPAGIEYRNHLEQWFNYLKKVATEKTDIKAIEDEVDLGQIEELIEIGKSELELVHYYAENKAWELVEEAQKDANELVDHLADSIYFTNPESRQSYKRDQAAKAAAAAAAAATPAAK
jgi:NADH dehydrogenase (ubiquinone) 1 alpha subcomplex subunit 5